MGIDIIERDGSHRYLTNAEAEREFYGPRQQRRPRLLWLWRLIDRLPDPPMLFHERRLERRIEQLERRVGGLELREVPNPTIGGLCPWHGRWLTDSPVCPWCAAGDTVTADPDG